MKSVQLFIENIAKYGNQLAGADNLYIISNDTHINLWRFIE